MSDYSNSLDLTLFKEQDLFQRATASCYGLA